MMDDADVTKPKSSEEVSTTESPPKKAKLEEKRQPQMGEWIIVCYEKMAEKLASGEKTGEMRARFLRKPRHGDVVWFAETASQKDKMPSRLVGSGVFVGCEKIEQDDYFSDENIKRHTIKKREDLPDIAFKDGDIKWNIMWIFKDQETLPEKMIYAHNNQQQHRPYKG